MINIQQIVEDAIDILWRRDWYPILNKLETGSIFDTQGINGEAIDIQYCLTEGKQPDDGQINQLMTLEFKLVYLFTAPTTGNS